MRLSACLVNGTGLSHRSRGLTKPLRLISRPQRHLISKHGESRIWEEGVGGGVMAIENFRTLSYLVKSRPSAKTAVSSLSLSLPLCH